MKRSLSRLSRTSVLVLCCATATAIGSASAQVPGRCEIPVSQRTGENGCYVSATVALGELPAGLLFWQLYTYPTRAAAESASGPRTTVVEAFGKVWLYAIAERHWRPSRGEHVTTLGPLPVRPGKRYTAHYVEAVFPPGMKTTVHRHPGPEASYVITGAECVETPNGKIVSRAGEGAVVGENVPMQLHTSGPGNTSGCRAHSPRYVASMVCAGARLDAQGLMHSINSNSCGLSRLQPDNLRAGANALRAPLSAALAAQAEPRA